MVEPTVVRDFLTHCNRMRLDSRQRPCKIDIAMQCLFWHVSEPRLCQSKLGKINKKLCPWHDWLTADMQDWHPTSINTLWSAIARYYVWAGARGSSLSWHPIDKQHSTLLRSVCSWGRQLLQWFVRCPSWIAAEHQACLPKAWHDFKQNRIFWPCYRSIFLQRIGPTLLAWTSAVPTPRKLQCSRSNSAGKTERVNACGYTKIIGQVWIYACSFLHKITCPPCSVTMLSNAASIAR